MRIRARILVAITCLSTLAISASAWAVPFGFTRITTNGSVNPESQFFVDVTDGGGGSALFTFTNTGSIASVISEIYFDDVAGTILSSLSSIVESPPTVDFSAGGSPGNLPSGNTLAPSFNADFMASANNPAPHRGVSPGETVGLLYDLDDSFSFADLISSISGGTFRIGLHVTGIGTAGQSESFVNSPPVPAPGAVLLGMIGLSAIPWARRRLS